VERCSGAGCTTFTQIATPTATSFNDTGLTASTSYSYRVRATDAAGNSGPFSNTSAAATQAAADTTPPGAPGTLNANAVSSTQINLSWAAATDNVGVTGYRVERCGGVGCTTFTQIATPTGTSFNDTGLTASTSYSYRVRAVDAAGNLGSFSSTSTAATQAAPDTTPPGAPGTLTATATSSTQVDLTWGAATDNVGVTGYRVERCAGAGCAAFAQIASSEAWRREPRSLWHTGCNRGLQLQRDTNHQVRALRFLLHADIPVCEVPADHFDLRSADAVAAGERARACAGF